MYCVVITFEMTEQVEQPVCIKFAVKLKNKFKVDKSLNISCDSIKVLEENIGRKISDISHSSIFPDMSPRARDIKERINKWDLIKVKSFCMAKENLLK